MRYRDLLIVERRRSEKGMPRAHKGKSSEDELEQFRDNAVKDLERMAGESGIPVEDLFISYTGLDKIGINPVSGYNTPIGVYCYPLKYALDRMKRSNDPSDVPYMGRQPHIWLFTPKNPDRGLDLSTYSRDQYDADMAKITDFLVKQGWDPGEVEEKIKDAAYTAKSVNNATVEAAMFWNVTRVLGKDFGKFKKLSRADSAALKAGDFVHIPEYVGWGEDYVGMVTKVNDDSANVKVYFPDQNKLDTSEMKDLPLKDLKKAPAPTNFVPETPPQPAQTSYKSLGSIVPGIGDTVMVTKGPFKDFEATVTNKVGNDYVLNVVIFGQNTPVKDVPLSYLELIKQADKTQEPDTGDNIKDFDGVDDELIDLDFEPEPEPEPIQNKKEYKNESVIREESNASTRAKTSIIEWNRLMRVAGYDYIVDPNDGGLIHPSEPTQAVFLSGAYLTTIGKIRNTARDTIARPPYSTDQINNGKYDPVTMERWLKSNYKKYSGIHALYPETVVIKSEKLISKMVSYDDLWLQIIKDASDRFGYLAIRAKAGRLAKLVRMKEDGYDINRAIRDLEAAYTGDPNDLKEVDRAFLENPEYIVEYIEHVRKGPWPEAEPAIAKDPSMAYKYARSILRKPWPAGEDAISKNAETAYNYASMVLHERFPKGEPEIKLDPIYAADYAVYVLEKPWPEAEPIIFTRSSSMKKYRKKFPLHTDVTALKAGDVYIERAGPLQKFVVIANTPGAGDTRITVHDMSNNGGLDETPVEFIVPLEKTRQGFMLGDEYKINKEGDTGTLVAIENEKYVFSYYDESNKLKRLQVNASEVFELNKSVYTEPKGFMIGDIVEFEIDWWQDGSSIERFNGYIGGFKDTETAVVKYGVWDDTQDVNVKDLKHYVGKYKK